MTLSVIIPVYNVAPYLDTCISSVLSQDVSDMEVILVDDGSTDASSSICDRYAGEDGRVRVVHQENKGPANARNRGLLMAQGDWLTFVDSDDFLFPGMYRHMLGQQRDGDADIVICGRYHVYGDRRVSYQKQGVCRLMSGEEALAMMNVNVLGYFDTAVCDKIFRRRLFDGVRFPEGTVCEDWFTLYKVLDRAKRVFYDSTPYYGYRQREGSITHRVQDAKAPVRAAGEVLAFVGSRYPDTVREAQFGYVFAVIGAIDSLLGKGRKEAVRAQGLRRQVLPLLKDVCTYPGLGGKRRMQVLLLRRSFFIYRMTFLMYKKWERRRWQ